MLLSNTFRLIIAIFICELAGVIGAIFTSSSVDTWYAGLAKPELVPPNWVFAPVWIMLYFLMGVSLFLIWKKGIERKDVKIALCFFALQIILNTLWSIIFFGLESPQAAFIEILALWATILATIIVFARLSKLAAALLVPYLLWVSFASYLNYMIWILNL